MQPEETDITQALSAPELTPPLTDAAMPFEVHAPQRVREPFWNYVDVALVLGLLFAQCVVIGLAVGLLTIRFPTIRPDDALLALPIQAVFYLCLYGSFRLDFYLRHHRTEVFRSLGWRRANVNPILVGAGGVLLAFFVSAIGVALRTPKIKSPFENMTQTPVSMALFALVAIALAPLFEELFFRGFLQPLFTRTFGTLAGVILTATLFGALHGFEYSWVWQYALLISLVGVALGLLRARTNSIIPGTVMHGCFNLVSVVALAFGKNI